MHAIHDAEAVINCISVLISPQLHDIGMSAISKVKDGQCLSNWNDNVKLWPCMFTGIEVIVNRVTSVHRDGQAAPPMYDLLVSAGTHTEAWLDLPDIRSRVLYDPCTVVALSGKVLRHGVKDWKGGERICFAHFIRDNVHNRLQLPRPDWVTIGTYVSLMDVQFINRHDWD
jgi:hypothetical protein